MKAYINIITTLILLIFSCGSKQKPSPPVTLEDNVGNTSIVIKYNSPRVRERSIWGDLVPYDKVWRTGANEATTIKTSEDIIIYDSLLEKGEYSFFTIPGKDNWTIIFNNISKQWGSYDYDSNQDVLRLKVVPFQSNKFFENMTFSIEDNRIIFNWENLSFSLKIEEL
tara:strand:- start:408 stop:911 length:504 start_codon:yes stop_codon:yes gene_type:complete